MNIWIILYVLMVTMEWQVRAEFSSNDTLACGTTYDVSKLGRVSRILSHEHFDRRSKYYSRKKCQWDLHLGNKCEQIKMFCVFLRTQSNYRCTKGDFLTIATEDGTKRKYCGTKKPTKRYPLLVDENIKIIWRTDRWKTDRGFD